MHTISVIGGTGDLGGGLALRWARAGMPVIIGSRDAARAQAAAQEINSTTNSDLASGASNEDAAAAGDIVVLAVKFDHQRATLGAIREHVHGKIVVDTTVPLVPPKVARVQLPPEGSAAVVAQMILGENTDVVSAFQNVSASALRGDEPIDCDVLVTGDKPAAREAVITLATAAGMRAWHAGPLANAAAAEALTSILIFINKKYASDHTGIRVSGVETHPD